MVLERSSNTSNDVKYIPVIGDVLYFPERTSKLWCLTDSKHKFNFCIGTVSAVNPTGSCSITPMFTFHKLHLLVIPSEIDCVYTLLGNKMSEDEVFAQYPELFL